MFIRRRPIRRVAGLAAVGGVGYYAGKKSAHADTAQDSAAQAKAAEAEAAKAKAQSSTSEDMVDRLKKFGELRDSGILTEEEFQREKQKILDAS